ncbi:hypothetical protein QJS10_CPB18g01795 [Acorus calamus]|uniref:Nonsense-mediated mRNA decay factor SMG8 n=1 Tax=Acorus calamus TaxID=4465 RepID=A0AAV9CJA3_ACOCL|nr:hypothetical protein QJS10_CPB18g01795 [Acorus calamus]
MLFVFRDDFLDDPSSGASTEDLMDASSLNPSTSSSATLRLSASKISPVPARPSSKTEGLKKKLQSSLDAQIRFLIKKCRTLAGAEGTHAGSRGLGNTSSLPLFSLDTSRAVMLLDRSTSHGGESPEYITSLVEEVRNLKGGLDVSVLENHCQNGNNEDIQSIKDFIFRQSDSLRGRAGSPASTNSGSAAGVGMLAVAAAAAAASAAAGKQSTPELPSFETWLSLSHLIYDVLLPVRGGSVYHDGSGGITYLQGDVTDHDAVGRLGKNSIEAVVVRLEGCRGLDRKFSTSWCQRTLPVAQDVYMKDLPACYPTALHKAQLEKALHAFSSMVKGPSVHLFMEKLEEECTSIWKSGRQLCDAVSLTGKPCIHQRHHTETSDLPESDIKPHSSGRQVLQKSGDAVVEGFAIALLLVAILKIGSNVVPVNINNVGWKKPVTSSEQFIAYVGFEHECPYGHRFLLSASHLKDLGLPYSLEEHDYSSNGSSDRISAESLLPKNYSMHDKFHPHSNGQSTGSMDKDMKMKKLKETPANGIQQDYTDNFFSRSEKDRYKSSHVHPHYAQFGKAMKRTFTI